MAARKPSDLEHAAGEVRAPAGGVGPPQRSPTLPRNREKAIALIRSQLSAGDPATAVTLARELVGRGKKDAEALLLLAVAMERAFDARSAMDAAKRVLYVRPDPDAYMIIARACRVMGETDRAIEACESALQLRPGEVVFQIQLAGILEEAGRVAEARAVVDPLMDRLESAGKPVPDGLRFEVCKLLVQEKDYDRAVEVLDELLGSNSTPGQLVGLCYYLKAKALDRSKRYADAFDAASRANEIGRVEYDPKLYEQQVSTLIENWSAARLDRFPIADCNEELPVFVAGMPRSGTSLIDQIIDAHPKAAGVGELGAIELFARQLSEAYDPDKEPPACFGSLNHFRWTRVAREYVKQIRGLAPDGAERVVNKALGNNKLVGLLARLFPRTRVIHALRDPRDVAISCYMGGFNNRLHAWTTRIDWVASAWEQSERMMEHWKSTLDIPILDVRYESLVRDPETQFPRLIEFLGLEWDDACREFYNSKRTVRTLSYDQVNRPLYATSAGRHANYAAQIEGVSFPTYPVAT